MTKCPICGNEFDDSAKFCPECGTKVTGPEGKAPAARDEKPLSMWDYVLMELVAKIPVVNLVLYFVWGFSGDTNLNRRNWSRSRLIWAAISLVISLLGISLLAVSGRAIYTAIQSLI